MSYDSRPGDDDRSNQPPKSKGIPGWMIFLIIAGICVISVPCVAIIIAIAVPNMLASKAAANQIATVGNLKTLQVAQTQYFKKTDHYAASGTQLYNNGALIDPELTAAFELFLHNGDSKSPQARYGYIYRMLQGEGTKPSSYVVSTSTDPEIMLSSWACTTRPSAPGASGIYEYYTTEAGVIYKEVDPSNGSWKLTAAPTPDNNPGWMANP